MLTSTKLQGFHYYQGKIQKCGYSFSLTQETRQQQTLITKLHFLHLGHRIHNVLQNGPKFFQSPIKNHATLFGSGRVVKPNQIKLGSTKPNSFFFFPQTPFQKTHLLHHFALLLTLFFFFFDNLPYYWLNTLSMVYWYC